MSTKDRIIMGDWGYAVVKNNSIWIPAIVGDLSLILNELYKRTKIKRMIFSAVLNPDYLKSHLKNIKKEWDEWFEEADDYSHCIEIEYEPKNNVA